MPTPRDKNGGAREAHSLKCAAGGRTTDATRICPQNWSLGAHNTGKITANKELGLFNPASDLSPAACLTMRFDGLNSSISCRIACRSSVAETTGNSSIRPQPKSRKGRRRAKHRQFLAETDSCRHIQIAGSAKASQQRLSSNSIRRNNLTEAGKTADPA